MWPLINSRKQINKPIIQNVTLDDDGNMMTIIHSKGAHRIRKEDVLDFEYVSDFKSKLRNKKNFLFLGGTFSSLLKNCLFTSIFGGILSLIFSISPFFVYYQPRNLSFWNPGIPYHPFGWFILVVVISLLFSLIFTIFVSRIIRLILNNEFFEKDILIIKKDNITIELKVGVWHGKLGFLNIQNSHFKEPDNWIYWLISKCPEYLLLLIIVFVFVVLSWVNHETPFWFNIGRWWEYWKYYAYFDDSGYIYPDNILKNTSYIKAFVDGMISGILISSVFVLLHALLIRIGVFFNPSLLKEKMKSEN